MHFIEIWDILVTLLNFGYFEKVLFLNENMVLLYVFLMNVILLI